MVYIRSHKQRVLSSCQFCLHPDFRQETANQMCAKKLQAKKKTETKTTPKLLDECGFGSMSKKKKKVNGDIQHNI